MQNLYNPHTPLLQIMKRALQICVCSCVNLQFIAKIHITSKELRWPNLSAADTGLLLRAVRNSKDAFVISCSSSCRCWRMGNAAETYHVDFAIPVGTFLIKLYHEMKAIPVPWKLMQNHCKILSFAYCRQMQTLTMTTKVLQ